MFSHVGYDAYNAALDATRADLADFIGDPGGATRVALTQSATDALNTLIGGMALPIRMPRKPGSTIVTTAEEHGSALMPTFARRLRGDRVSVLPHRDDPTFLADLRREFADGASALVISLVSCKSGKVLPVTEATRIAHDAGGTVIVDCAQAAGQIPVDVNALGADAYAFLGYKWLHGPLGVGAMWIRDLAKFDVLRMGWRSQTAMDLDGNIKLKDDAARSSHRREAPLRTGPRGDPYLVLGAARGCGYRPPRRGGRADSRRARLALVSFVAHGTVERPGRDRHRRRPRARARCRGDACASRGVRRRRVTQRT